MKSNEPDVNESAQRFYTNSQISLAGTRYSSSNSILFTPTQLIVMLVFLNSKNEKVIAFFVEEFLNTHEQIRSEDLQKLEKEIRGAVAVRPMSAQPTRPSTSDATNRQSTNGTSKDPKSVRIINRYKSMLTCLSHHLIIFIRWSGYVWWSSKWKEQPGRQWMAVASGVPSSR